MGKLLSGLLLAVLTTGLAHGEPKSEGWGDEMRAHMKRFEKDKAAAAEARAACDKLKPSERADDARCVALERRAAIDAVRSKSPKGVF